MMIDHIKVFFSIILTGMEKNNEDKADCRDRKSGCIITS